MSGDKQAPALLGALLGTFSGSICCVSPVWDGLPTTALLALQQELGFTTVQHAGLNPVSFRCGSWSWLSLHLITQQRLTSLPLHQHSCRSSAYQSYYVCVLK